MIWKLFCFLWCTPEKEKNKQKKRLDKQWICRWFGTPWCPCVAGWCFVFHPLKQKFDKGCEIMLLCYRRLYIPTAITCNVMNALPRMIPRVGHRFINILRPSQNDGHFAGDILECIILDENCCIVLFTDVCSWWMNWHYMSIGSGNVWAPNRHGNNVDWGQRIHMAF